MGFSVDHDEDVEENMEQEQLEVIDMVENI